jgi:hypothetical protein
MRILQLSRNTCKGLFPPIRFPTLRLPLWSSLVAALDSLDLHDQSMLAWAQVVQMTTMLRLFEEDVSTASIKPMAEQIATLLIVASS